MKPGSPARVALYSLAALALFSAIFTLAAFYDWWPRLPPGSLHDTDLWAGFAGGVFLLVLILRERAPKLAPRQTPWAPSLPPSVPNVP